MTPGGRAVAVLAAALAGGAAAGCGGPDAPVPLPEAPTRGAPVSLPDEPHRAFDFWVGTWNVANRHLRRGGWVDSGEAVARIRWVANRTAVLEQWDGALGGDPLTGFSLRAWDPATGTWPVWLNWHGGRPNGFDLMVGERNGERLELFPPGGDRGTRYTFSFAHEESCRWDQATSEDGGTTWISDWTMDFSRTGPAEELDASNAPLVGPPASSARYGRTRELDFLLGAWSGPARVPGEDGREAETRATVRVSSMIEGFGLLQFVDTADGARRLAALGWDAGAEAWVAIDAAGAPDGAPDGLRRLTGAVDGRRATFTGDGVRFLWDCPDEGRCRLERAVSADGGATWTTVLAADLRRDATAVLPPATP